jgi:hypothetical protein
MTETEWLACTDPRRMVAQMGDKASNRKLRLFACACCRRLGTLLPDQSHPLVEIAEQYADGLASEEERQAAEQAAVASCALHQDNRAAVVAWDACMAIADAADAAEATEGVISWDIDPYGFYGAHYGEAAINASMLRDIFGNPFRPVAVDPRWLSWKDETVVKVAQAIYDERAFDRLPILADALEDAGCTDSDILTHCRQAKPDEHVRGCWVVDLLLGRE